MSAGSRDNYDIGSMLSQMREEYWLGLSEEVAEQQELLECLLLTMGNERFAFETRHASEVMRIPRLIPLPAVPEIVTGIFNLRGEITAALDVRPLLGLPQPEIGATGRIVVVKAKLFATGILAESAPGVQGLPLADFEPLPPEERREFVKGNFHPEGGRVMLIDMEALLASPQILIGY